MKYSHSIWSCLVLTLILFAFPASAAKRPQAVAGWLEHMAFDDGAVLVKAKLDTGAKTSSINAENIKRFKRDGKSWVRFDLALKTLDGKVERIALEKPLVRNVLIKEHEAENDRRPVVMLDFCLDKQLYAAQFTLVDRSKFLYPVLVGRRFLSGKYVINPARTYLTTAECKPASDQNQDTE